MPDINKREEFEIMCLHLIEKYNKNIGLLAIETTKEIFRLTRDTSNKYVMETTVKKMNLGKFYLIRYNYNGNKIWCPIFAIEYKIVKNKNILYAINLDYLPYKYKAKFFGKIFYLFKDEILKSEKMGNAKEEYPLKGVNFDRMYKALKANGGYDFAITAFDMSKIKKVYAVSLGMVYRFIFLNTKMVNSEQMEVEKINATDIDTQKKYEELIKILEDLDKEYNIDVKDYYKQLKAIESKYKLVENAG